MSLSRCPDCGNAVSSLAKHCPQCGRPFQGVQLIEQTGKAHKVAQMIGLGMVLVGMVGCVVSPAGNDFLPQIWSTLITLAGCLICLFGRLTGWWHHG